MYKTTHDKTSFLDRSASHSTKPRRDLSGLDERDLVRQTEIARLPYDEARAEQERLRARVQTAYGSDRRRIETELFLLKRHIGNLHQIADAANDYKTLCQAIEDLYGKDALANSLSRKLEIQNMITDATTIRRKPRGTNPKPVHLRTGGTMEQAIAAKT